MKNQRSKIGRWYQVRARYFEKRADRKRYGLKHGFGRGKAAWKNYGPPHRPAQYLIMREILGYPFIMSEHWNLCGQLVVMAALGLDLVEGFTIFAKMYGGKDILDRRTQGTTISNLINFIVRANDVSDVVNIDGIVEFKSYSTIQDQFLEDQKAGYKQVLLVTINQAGDVDPDGTIAHWVWFLGMDRSMNYVIYNPYDNLVETISKDVFPLAWETTPGNNGRYVAVIFKESGSN